MSWKINVGILLIFSIASLLLSFFNVIFSFITLIVFYIIDLLKPPYYSNEEMEKPIVFISPLLIILSTVYIIYRLLSINIIFLIILSALFISDLALSFKRAKK
ncbi:hypothetical protein SACC_28880 [Saccharolobus caldissimus]|uniref:Uncharacterized protein n=1 Tax=Saccharolobus caldissimus TaxID=1702097 RepID=A0AAQ4CVP0_9CREN|nr:hypothetical protein SACC_28880 [Saccharolobus caldissimus]